MGAEDKELKGWGEEDGQGEDEDDEDEGEKAEEDRRGRTPENPS